MSMSYSNASAFSRCTALLLLLTISGASTLSRSGPTQLSRQAFGRVAGSAFVGAALAPLVAPPAPAIAAAAAANEEFGDLPPQSVRAFKQFRGALQFAGDYMLYELHDSVADVSKWTDIAAMMQSASANGQGQPSVVSRLILIPMQQIALAFPPEVTDELADAKNEMERSLQRINRATRMTNDAVSTGASSAQLADAEEAWQAGRLALNKFYALVNTAIGQDLMQPIPKAEKDGFVRSRARYTQFKKGLAICQNRGGTNLAGVWGGLMVYGTATDPCGALPTVESYLSI